MTADLATLFGSEKPMPADAVDRVRDLYQNVIGSEGIVDGLAQELRQAQRELTRDVVGLGRELLAIRKCWPARGPNAKGWGDFLAAVGISQDSALRYMNLAKSNDKAPQFSRTAGKPGVVEVTRKYVAGIRKLLTRNLHEKAFGSVVAAELRDLADELESSAEYASEYAVAYERHLDEIAEAA